MEDLCIPPRGIALMGLNVKGECAGTSLAPPVLLVLYGTQRSNVDP